MQVELIRAKTPHLLAAVIERCEKDHYLKRWPDPRSLPFAYVVKVDGQTHAPDGRINGLLVFKKLQHHKQRGLFGYPGLPTAWQVLDMARVWIHPDHQRPGLNLFSRAVGMAMKRVQRDWIDHHPPRFPDLPYHVELIVSYADYTYHRGTSYRACNFVKWGEADNKSCFIYRLKTPRWSWVPSMAWSELPLWAVRQ
jgi:hypothetical protein